MHMVNNVVDRKPIIYNLNSCTLNAMSGNHTGKSEHQRILNVFSRKIFLKYTTDSKYF